MQTLIYFNGSLHVLDAGKKCFVKSNATNIARAMDVQRQQVGYQWRPSRAELLRRSMWIKEQRQGKPYYRAGRAREVDSLMNSGDDRLTLYQLRSKNERLS